MSVNQVNSNMLKNIQLPAQALQESPTPQSKPDNGATQSKTQTELTQKIDEYKKEQVKADDKKSEQVKEDVDFKKKTKFLVSIAATLVGFFIMGKLMKEGQIAVQKIAQSFQERLGLENQLRQQARMFKKQERLIDHQLQEIGEGLESAWNKVKPKKSRYHVTSEGGFKIATDKITGKAMIVTDYYPNSKIPQSIEKFNYEDNIRFITWFDAKGKKRCLQKYTIDAPGEPSKLLDTTTY